MDRRETMPMLGPPYYMQRQIPELHGEQGFQQFPNSSMPFQLDVGGQSSNHGLVVPTEANVGNGSSAVLPSGVAVKKKRGRPRKYGHEGAASLSLSSSPLASQELNINPTTTTTTTITTTTTTPVAPQTKRGRGRPPGTGKKQQQQQQEDVSGHVGNCMPSITGVGFTPHVIPIAAGEDIAGKVMSFARQGRRAVCVMSVNGTVSSVTLHQASSGGTVTYEGRFDILHMSGSFLPMDIDASLNRSEGLSISLISPDGRVFGGGVGGMLLAASPVQVILGSFVGGSAKTKQKTVGNHVGDEIEHRSPDMAATSNLQHSQTPTSSSMGGVWPSPQAVEMQSSHFDIDLMRG